ncbi:hypothetical protein [Rhizobium leguminosarum]|uniref:hypothetical protein n=1 Tax=Rhizobium leguminosarum TaxID=384 RepID=UPI001C96D4FA|nr:hypothetical protein [Rhizobium leguminosarum]MBY5511852.1 hypothetical protein [Rhizobium leguminosarum]
MSVVVRPDPDDKFIKIAINGELVDATNEHQDFEFEVYADDGTPIGTEKKGREAFDKALGALRVFNDRQIMRAAGIKEDLIRRTSNLTESYAASGENSNIAVRIQDTDIEFAVYDFGIEHPDPEELEWRPDDDPDTTFVI